MEAISHVILTLQNTALNDSFVQIIVYLVSSRHILNFDDFSSKFAAESKRKRVIILQYMYRNEDRCQKILNENGSNLP